MEHKSNRRFSRIAGAFVLAALCLAAGCGVTGPEQASSPPSESAGLLPAPLLVTSKRLAARAPVGVAVMTRYMAAIEPPKPEFKYINPVTGLPMEKEPQRPLAVVINNIKVATPQPGVAEYDLMFEYPAEGEITRLVDVMYDWSGVESLGSVRSMRDYFMIGARPLDPIFIHYGHSPAAQAYINANRTTNLNGIYEDIENKLFWRDAGRAAKMGWEHSVLTSAAKIDAALAAFVGRTATENTEPFFDFSGWKGGESAKTVNVNILQGLTRVFTWDGEKYLRSQFGAPHTDGGTGEQLYCDSLIVIKTYCRQIPGDEQLRRRVDLVGGGEGYAFANGQAVKIDWSKASDSEFFVFSLADGSPLTLDPGRVWICVMDTTRSVSYE